MNAQNGKLLIALLLLSAGINVALGSAIWKTRLHASQSEAPIGKIVPPIVGLDAGGHKVVVPYSTTDLPTVIYVFSPSCAFCKRNADNVTAMARQLAGRYRLLGVSTTTKDIDRFVADHKIDFPVFTQLEPSVHSAFRMGVTPQTFVVSRDGILLKTWKGAYLGSSKSAVEGFFSYPSAELSFC